MNNISDHFLELSNTAKYIFILIDQILNFYTSQFLFSWKNAAIIAMLLILRELWLFYTQMDKHTPRENIFVIFFCLHHQFITHYLKNQNLATVFNLRDQEV
jgi:hypothetical protein